jgi:4-amino-4-deoxy-L-arabinose transferase-like glycosyltransferase
VNKIHSFDRWFVGLLFFATLLLFVRLGSAPIYILDEAKNAQCAREMLDRNDWVVPSFNGSLRTDKPALHYWFMRIAYTLGGVGAAQARFFSALLGLLLMVVTYVKVKNWVEKGVAFFSAAALVLSPHLLFEFRLSVPDPYLIFFTTLGLFFGYEYIEKSKRLSLFFAATSLGVAMLAKGPVALALPGLVFLIFVLVKKKWSVFKDPFIIIAVFIALAITFPWYYAVHHATDGAFTKGFFLDHNLNRFSAEKEGHGGPFIITPLIVLVGMLPSSLLAIGALGKKSGLWKEPLFLFSFLVVSVYVVFFSISSTKLPNYPMPCYPFVAILAGYYLYDVYSGLKTVRVSTWVTWLVLAFAIPIGGYVALKNEAAVSSFAWVSLLLFILPAGILIAFFQRKQVVKSFFITAISWFLFAGIILWVGYPIIYKENPVTKLIPEMKGKSMLFAYKAYNPAFNFNLPENGYLIPVAENVGSLKAMIDERERAEEEPIYLITRLDYLPELEHSGFREIGRHRDLFELPTTVILKFFSEN